MPNVMNAIDLYSGVGGWSLGLRLAGIKVCASYERSEAANETNRLNNRHTTFTTDIRKMDFSSIPKTADVVVGSPPCTQFSFSNRGGNGDLSDGLADVVQFFRIIDFLKPAKWAMENVPRLSQILDKELLDGGILAQFNHLDIRYDVFNMEEFGLPQRRRRCIVGNFDFDLLRSYRSETARRTLGDVINGLSESSPRDPIFDFRILSEDLHDHDREEQLNEEETRINSAAKTLHPIYNAMPFPDPLDRAVRTITATCTRVSRESIVVAQDEDDHYRRLSVRERASAQGFPISYQFYGSSHGQKLKMVGNAIPPLFSFYIGHALQGTPTVNLPALEYCTDQLHSPQKPPATKPHTRGFRYRADRSFKFAIPNLRLKSGVRFELSNDAHSGSIDWHVMLVFGTSKAIRKCRPHAGLEINVLSYLDNASAILADEIIQKTKAALLAVDVSHMQAVWSHAGPGLTRPFMLLDLLDNVAGDLIAILKMDQTQAQRALTNVLPEALGEDVTSGTSKLLTYAPIILAGMVVGSLTNTAFSRSAEPKDSIMLGKRSARR